MKKLIGIAGKARSGKDTFAHMMRNNGLNLDLYSFATPLKEAAIAMLGISRYFAYNATTEQKEQPLPGYGFSYREFLQKLGTEFGREMLRGDIWLLCAQERFNQSKNGLLITDVRFANEAHWIRSNGGRIIHILRPDAPEVREHISEKGLDTHPEDRIYINNKELHYMEEDAILMVNDF